MAKTKAKRVPYRDFNPRDRYSIETWRKVKSLFNQGFKRAQIEDQMKIKLHKRTFNQNMKKNYEKLRQVQSLVYETWVSDYL